MDIIAKYRSYGFRGKGWERGEIAKNITEKEKLMSEMKHFEVVGKTELTSEPVKIDDEILPISIQLLRDEYVKRYKKDVPNRYKNDMVWLKEQVDKEEQNV
jgi:hypothetical protein